MNKDGITVHTTPERLLIDVKTRQELDAALDAAVRVLKPKAIAKQVGISVTRLSPGRYEARLNSSVPPGETLERWGKLGGPADANRVNGWGTPR